MKNGKFKKILLSLGLGLMLGSTMFLTTGCANIDLKQNEIDSIIDYGNEFLLKQNAMNSELRDLIDEMKEFYENNQNSQATAMDMLKVLFTNALYAGKDVTNYSVKINSSEFNALGFETTKASHKQNYYYNTETNTFVYKNELYGETSENVVDYEYFEIEKNSSNYYMYDYNFANNTYTTQKVYSLTYPGYDVLSEAYKLFARFCSEDTKIKSVVMNKLSDNAYEFKVIEETPASENLTTQWIHVFNFQDDKFVKYNTEYFYISNSSYEKGNKYNFSFELDYNIENFQVDREEYTQA